MIPKIVDVLYQGDYTLRITFSDGIQGDIDLEKELYGEIFEPLRDKNFFSKVSIHPDFRTLYWPNGADLAPEFIYEHIRVLSL